MLDNLNLLTQKTYFDSIVSNQNPHSQHPNLSNTQVIKQVKHSHAGIEGTQTSEATISVSGHHGHHGQAYDHQRNRTTVQGEASNGLLQRLESGHSDHGVDLAQQLGLTKSTKRKGDSQLAQTAGGKSPKKESSGHGQKDTMRKSAGPDGYQKSRQAANFSMISDQAQLQQQILNRTLEGSSNREIKIPINPVTGGVNKSVFYGTQPMHSHIQHIKQEIY